MFEIGEKLPRILGCPPVSGLEASSFTIRCCGMPHQDRQILSPTRDLGRQVNWGVTFGPNTPSHVSDADMELTKISCLFHRDKTMQAGELFDASVSQNGRSKFALRSGEKYLAAFFASFWMHSRHR